MHAATLREGAGAPRAAGLRKLLSCMLLGIQGLADPAIAVTPSLALMRDGGITIPPEGWIEFCARNPLDPACGEKTAPIEPVVLDEAHWQHLKQIEATVLHIQPETDYKQFGVAEYWQIATKAGDCEDIALAARQRLLDSGWPRSALRLATAYTEDGEYHTVLTIDVLQNGKPETLVIDCRYDRVMHWTTLEEAGYHFVSRQAADGPEWVSIEPERPGGSRAAMGIDGDPDAGGVEVIAGLTIVDRPATRYYRA